MNQNSQTNNDKSYDPKNDPNSVINFLIREREMLKVRGKTDTREYRDLCKIINENLRRYKD